MGQLPSLPVVLLMLDALQEIRRPCNNDVKRRPLELATEAEVRIKRDIILLYALRALSKCQVEHTTARRKQCIHVRIMGIVVPPGR